MFLMCRKNPKKYEKSRKIMEKKQNQQS